MCCNTQNPEIWKLSEARLTVMLNVLDMSGLGNRPEYLRVKSNEWFRTGRNVRIADQPAGVTSERPPVFRLRNCPFLLKTTP